MKLFCYTLTAISAALIVFTFIETLNAFIMLADTLPNP